MAVLCKTGACWTCKSKNKSSVGLLLLILTLFCLANEVRDSIVPLYGDYLQYQRAAKQVMRRLGIPIEIPNTGDGSEPIIDNERVDEMLSISEGYYFDLTGEPFSQINSGTKPCPE